MCYRLSSFANGRYLLSGSNNGRAYIWNATVSLPLIEQTSSCLSSTNNEQIRIENRFPLHELCFTDTEDISLIHGDSSTMSIYNSSDSQYLYKWNFEHASSSASKNRNNMIEWCDFYGPMNMELPKCRTYQYTGSMGRSLQTQIQNNTNQQQYSYITLNRPVTPLTSSLSSSLKSKQPLSQITSFMYNNKDSKKKSKENCEPQQKTNDDDIINTKCITIFGNNKRLRLCDQTYAFTNTITTTTTTTATTTTVDTLSSSLLLTNNTPASSYSKIQLNKSSSNNRSRSRNFSKESIKKSKFNSRRNLFSQNRKISDYFSIP